jgi:hypothetical protein
MEERGFRAEQIHGERLDTLTPPVLYKYYTLSKWTQAIFERDEIYFPSPDCFNDPFDSKVYTTYEGTEEQRVRRLVRAWQTDQRQKGLPAKREELLRPKALDLVKRRQDIQAMLETSRQSSERLRQQMGIFCMTSERDNILMWSHYADTHKGFCLGFKTDNPFFGRALRVNYSRDCPYLNVIEPPDIDKVGEALLTKARDWEYEREWRIVDHGHGPGIQMYPHDALCKVILGCRIDAENMTRIIQWCHARSPRPALYVAKEKDKEFGLDIVAISH